MLVGVVIALGACSETGDPAEYDSIDATSDCDRLQTMLAEYRAQAEASDESGSQEAEAEFQSYAEATQRRLENLGCS